jgi:hypothetical protein
VKRRPRRMGPGLRQGDGGVNPQTRPMADMANEA